MTLSTIVILTLTLLCAWTFGGIVLRLMGALIALAALIGLSLSGDASGILAFALGACFWLAGHLHFRLRRGAFKGALAECILRKQRNGHTTPLLEPNHPGQSS